uniref:Uncharacterized protein n=1 Tax=Cacopsylla melanoneura TaxID=428564 RepID=A0A8D8SPW8_9HEMI
MERVYHISSPSKFRRLEWDTGATATMCFSSKDGFTQNTYIYHTHSPRRNVHHLVLFSTRYDCILKLDASELRCALSRVSGRQKGVKTMYLLLHLTTLLYEVPSHYLSTKYWFLKKLKSTI